MKKSSILISVILFLAKNTKTLNSGHFFLVAGGVR